MELTESTYVPSIRWRQAEYQALLHLQDAIKDRIVPFIMIPNIEYDFEERRPKRTVQEHVRPFAKRFRSKWTTRPAWIGVDESIVQSPMDDGTHILAHIFSELRSFFGTIVPAIPLSVDKDTAQIVRAIMKRDERGVGISVRLEDLMSLDLNSRLQALISGLNVNEGAVDLFVDLQAPNFVPPQDFCGSLIKNLSTLVDLDRYRNLIIVSTAMPSSMGDIPVGATKIRREDWLFFKYFVAHIDDNIRRPNFGDYTVVHPTFSAIDMRMIKSAGKIVYTTPSDWWVWKGVAFQGNQEQMHDHCAELVKNSIFKGEGFSYGDKYIVECATRKKSPGNLTLWKGVTINHHITQVVHDLAKLSGVTYIGGLQ